MNFEIKRTIQASISVGLCVFVYQIFKLESVFYAAIASVIASKEITSHTFDVGFKRIYGTFIGAIIGFLFSYLPFNPIIFVIGIAIILTLCGLLKHPAGNVACIVFIAILIKLRPNKTPFEYSLERLLETTLGIFISIGVAILLNYIDKKYKIFPKKD